MASRVIFVFMWYDTIFLIQSVVGDLTLNRSLKSLFSRSPKKNPRRLSRIDSYKFVSMHKPRTQEYGSHLRRHSGRRRSSAAYRPTGQVPPPCPPPPATTQSCRGLLNTCLDSCRWLTMEMALASTPFRWSFLITSTILAGIRTLDASISRCSPRPRATGRWEAKHT
jgi:hypothetical protein